MIEGDITNRTIYRKIIKEARNNQCDFILATPPCQGMSTAGLKLKDDPRNRLIMNVVKAIKAIKKA
jgi:DNA (cytosine-5)-methyltransferase 1